MAFGVVLVARQGRVKPHNTAAHQHGNTQSVAEGTASGKHQTHYDIVSEQQQISVPSGVGAQRHYRHNMPQIAPCPAP